MSFKVGDVVEYLGWESSAWPDTRAVEQAGRLLRGKRYMIIAIETDFRDSVRLWIDSHSSNWGLSSSCVRKVGAVSNLKKAQQDFHRGLPPPSSFALKIKRNLPDWF